VTKSSDVKVETLAACTADNVDINLRKRRHG